MKKLNCIFMGSMPYPKGYADTKRKQHFLDYIINKGDSVQVLVTLKLSRVSKINNNKGIYRNVPYEVLGPYVKHNMFFMITFIHYIFNAFIRLYQYKKKNHKNIIVTSTLNYDNILPIFFARTIGYKIVLDILEDYSTMSYSGTIHKRFKLFIVKTLPKLFQKKLASGISVISNHLLKKETLCHHEIPIKLISVSAGNLNLHHEKRTNKSFKVLYSGTYGEKDGVDNIIIAYSEIEKKYMNTNLYLTGHCLDYIEKLVDRVIKNHEKIVFTGYLNDEVYYQYLKDADILLMTRSGSAYANAGFPFKLGEYLATGNPVISTNVSDVSLYLKDKESVILIPPDNVDALIEAIEYVINFPEEAIKIGAMGRRVCEKYFNPSINSVLFYDLLCEI